MRGTRKTLIVAAMAIALAGWMSPGRRSPRRKFMNSRSPWTPYPTIPGTWGWSFYRRTAEEVGGRLAPKYYHSAQLYKDAHVTKALRTGTVEMAVPGNWVLEGFDTSTSLTMLPMFFGQPGKMTEDLIDGEVGKAVNQSLEKKVGVKSPGRWFELGYDNTWTRSKKITKWEDFKGLKIRHSGGSIPEDRLNAFGASAYSSPGRTCPWLWSRGPWTAFAPPPKAWKAPNFTRRASSTESAAAITTGTTSPWST